MNFESESDDTQTEIVNAENEDTETTEETTEEEVTLTTEQIADLQKAAQVSSQNFERAKKAEQEKKELQEKLSLLETQLETDQYVDTDVDVVKKLNELTNKFDAIEREKELDQMELKYPALKDKRTEFTSFRLDYPSVAIESVAKVFLAEHDLLSEPPKRKGLEKAGGGQRVAPTNGKFSAEDVKRLRETNYSEYMKLIKSGKLQLSN